MSKLINISNASFIALHSVAIVARLKGIVTIKKIAEITAMSENHIAKVIQTLVKNGYLKSVRGPKGGFELGKQTKSIFLIDLFELIEGKIKDDTCPTACAVCSFKTCIFGGLPRKHTNEFREYLARTSLDIFLKAN